MQGGSMMQEKDTEQLFSELKEDADVKSFLSRNKNELLPPVSEYLRGLLQEKGLRLSEIIKESHLKNDQESVFHRQGNSQARN